MRVRLDIRVATRPVRYNCRVTTRQFRYTGVPKARQGDLMRSLCSRENGRKCRALRGSIYGSRRAPFDIIAASIRGNFDILPLRAIRDALALLAREPGKGKRLSLFSSRLPRDISNDPETGSYIETSAHCRGGYIELRGMPRNISSARQRALRLRRENRGENAARCAARYTERSALRSI